LQDGVVVHGDIGFDVIVERDATIGHRAVLHGCIVRQGGLVGMGAIVLDGAIVGEEAMVAAGSVVLPGSQIEPRTLWAGSPARFKRDLRDADVDNIRAGAKLYRSKAAKAVKGAAR
jgi:carbonic anhydrase/acetyltransferase-like protein (isoleucine patch superfamily)